MARGYSLEERLGKSLPDTGWWDQTGHQATAQDISKEIAARFYQMLSRHAIMTVSLKERWRWADSDPVMVVRDR